MSRFYASISGQAQTQATRRGGKESGIEGHIRGWNIGIKVVGQDEKGNDVFDVYLTSGSTGSRPSRHIGTFRREDL